MIFKVGFLTREIITDDLFENMLIIGLVCIICNKSKGPLAIYLYNNGFLTHLLLYTDIPCPLDNRW